MKVLVTGASGFLGGHIVDGCLREGHHVRALVRENSNHERLRAIPGLEVVRGDLRDAESLRRATQDIDIVHHSAARVVDYGSHTQFRDTNVDGTRRLLEAARTAGAHRFVFISSPSALMRPGDGDRLDIDESTPYPNRWFNHYSQTKAAAEQLVLAANEPAFTTCALRPRGVWGPRDHSGFLPKLVAKMRDGRLPDLSGGKQVQVSLCHCDNAVAACLRAAAAPPDRVGGKAYFIADRERTDLWAFLATLADILELRPPTRTVPLPLTNALAQAVELIWRLPPLTARAAPPLSRYAMALLTRSSTYNTGAAERDFGFTPHKTQDTGLRELLAWIESTGGVERFTKKAK
ncbi:NAD-dependent epimerase/dehydratase family protein [Streptomyces inhibens]|uniref:NAD-dependent epimerase/dehydratase family protein n=1 Tax=Streptomyces inhibens TaxID=2293571 RepID=A0A371QAU6_STRIH|nr:NAD-dependent epimerase/dehydratase family protein [Streptomyces inhibens]REK91804.1 NAD-dependent epimerase/dehydratase family protein [Streptomyces inhibens]